MDSRIIGPGTQATAAEAARLADIHSQCLRRRRRYTWGRGP